MNNINLKQRFIWSGKVLAISVGVIFFSNATLAADEYTPPPVKGNLNIQDDIVSHTGDIITKNGDILINGLLKIGGSNATCNDKTIGMIRAVSSTIQVCNGSDWQTAKGDKGDKGEKGDQGDQGYTGERGNQGRIGDTGDQGVDGAQGSTGDAGTTGQTGSQGTQGIQGEQGLQGPKGDDGDSVFLEIGDNVVYSGGLEVDSIKSMGFVKIGQSNSICNSVIEGAMRFNQTDKMMEFCNGSAWLVMAYTQVSRDNPDNNIPQQTVFEFAEVSSGVVEVPRGMTKVRITAVAGGGKGSDVSGLTSGYSGGNGGEIIDVVFDLNGVTEINYIVGDKELVRGEGAGDTVIGNFVTLTGANGSTGGVNYYGDEAVSGEGPYYYSGCYRSVPDHSITSSNIEVTGTVNASFSHLTNPEYIDYGLGTGGFGGYAQACDGIARHTQGQLGLSGYIKLEFE